MRGEGDCRRPGPERRQGWRSSAAGRPPTRLPMRTQPVLRPSPVTGALPSSASSVLLVHAPPVPVHAHPQALRARLSRATIDAEAARRASAEASRRASRMLERAELRCSRAGGPAGEGGGEGEPAGQTPRDEDTGEADAPSDTPSNGSAEGADAPSGAPSGGGSASADALAIAGLRARAAELSAQNAALAKAAARIEASLGERVRAAEAELASLRLALGGSQREARLAEERRQQLEVATEAARLALEAERAANAALREEARRAGERRALREREHRRELAAVAEERDRQRAEAASRAEVLGKKEAELRSSRAELEAHLEAAEALEAQLEASRAALEAERQTAEAAKRAEISSVRRALEASRERERGLQMHVLKLEAKAREDADAAARERSRAAALERSGTELRGALDRVRERVAGALDAFVDGACGGEELVETLRDAGVVVERPERLLEIGRLGTVAGRRRGEGLERGEGEQEASGADEAPGRDATAAAERDASDAGAADGTASARTGASAADADDAARSLVRPRSPSPPASPSASPRSRRLAALASAGAASLTSDWFARLGISATASDSVEGTVDRRGDAAGGAAGAEAPLGGSLEGVVERLAAWRGATRDPLDAGSEGRSNSNASVPPRLPSASFLRAPSAPLGPPTARTIAAPRSLELMAERAAAARTALAATRPGATSSLQKTLADAARIMAGSVALAGSSEKPALRRPERAVSLGGGAEVAGGDAGAVTLAFGRDRAREGGASLGIKEAKGERLAGSGDQSGMPSWTIKSARPRIGALGGDCDAPLDDDGSIVPR